MLQHKKTKIRVHARFWHEWRRKTKTRQWEREKNNNTHTHTLSPILFLSFLAAVNNVHSFTHTVTLCFFFLCCPVAIRELHLLRLGYYPWLSSVSNVLDSLLHFRIFFVFYCMNKFSVHISNRLSFVFIGFNSVLHGKRSTFKRATFFNWNLVSFWRNVMENKVIFCNYFIDRESIQL